MLNKYYADVDLQTSMLPYLDENRQMPIDLRTKGMNPNWRGWNTNAVNSMTNRQNEFDTRIEMERHAARCDARNGRDVK